MVDRKKEKGQKRMKIYNWEVGRKMEKGKGEKIIKYTTGKYEEAEEEENGKE